MDNHIDQLVAWDDLPDDLWVNILRCVHLHDHRDQRRLLKPISLVSKRFHNLSRYALIDVVLQPSQTVQLARICNRFTCITQLRLVGPTPDLDTIVNQLAHTALPLQNLELIHQTHFPRDPMRILGHNMRKTLKSLTCDEFKTLVDEDLDIVADCFPYIVYFSAEGTVNAGQITDEGVRLISSKIKSIKTLNLYQQPNISGRSLQYLASNSPSLKNLLAGIFRPNNGNISVICLNQFIFSQSLSCICLYGVKISERMLAPFTAANLKIWAMIITCPRLSTDIKGATLCKFFKSFKFLSCFELHDFPFPLDITADDFVRSIRNIKLFYFHSGFIDPISTTALLFSLLKECPVFVDIKITSAVLQPPLHPIPGLNNFPVHFRVRKLLLGCLHMDDDMLLLFVLACPKLESLALIKCPNITEEGIHKLKISCSNIRFLYVEACKNVRNRYCVG